MKRVMLPSAPILNRKRYALQKTVSSTTASTIPVENDPLPLDSVSAFEAIVRQVSSTSGFPLAIPGCFVHQIHVIIRDRTLVNQELQNARNRCVLRQLHVENCGILLVREQDYRGLIENLYINANEDIVAKKEAMVLEKFLTKVLPGSTDLSISQTRLCELMGMADDKDRVITLTLLRLGFIVFQTHGPNVEFESSFWFTLPNMRALISEVEAARKEFLSMIQKAKPYRELILSKLRAKGKFKGSSMSLEFHIKDVVGSGLIIARDTAIEGNSSLFLLPDKLTG